ncbi:MAG TPA: type II toxin-antitoxin system PemK/MazF family toxin [Verrucomicrobiae bacterium]|jgi:mRNA-degrading endonuclease toxin of MazEF toxin-antitoxin module|nr:type II toxin-antitoxin system PemK/MazF family toxin [Verrucomicrobiae bacterium]
MISRERGDVVIVDLGMTSNVRPCVVLSIPSPDSTRNMSVVALMTTEIRAANAGSLFPKPPWLKENSVVNVIGIAGVDNARILKRIGSFPESKMTEISRVLTRMLRLQAQW